MKRTPMSFVAVAIALLWTSQVHAQTGRFDADRMLSELESQLKLSGEKLSKLEPAIDAKSAELKRSIDETVAQGYMEMEALSEQLDAASRAAEAQLKEALSSEEMQQLNEFLRKWDREAVDQIREALVAHLSALLELTEAQVLSLKPVLEEAFAQLSAMLDQLALEGNGSMEEFKRRYEELNRDLQRKLEDRLDTDQLETLERHRDRLREDIRETSISV